MTRGEWPSQPDEVDANSSFNSYLPPGYEVFTTLSELGSHPGFLHIVPFYADPETNVVNVNLSGAPLDRALWVALGFEMFGDVTDNVGTAYGWAACSRM